MASIYAKKAEIPLKDCGKQNKQGNPNTKKMETKLVEAYEKLNQYKDTTPITEERLRHVGFEGSDYYFHFTLLMGSVELLKVKDKWYPSLMREPEMSFEEECSVSLIRISGMGDLINIFKVFFGYTKENKS